MFTIADFIKGYYYIEHDEASLFLTTVIPILVYIDLPETIWFDCYGGGLPAEAIYNFNSLDFFTGGDPSKPLNLLIDAGLIGLDTVLLQGSPSLLCQ